MGSEVATVEYMARCSLRYDTVVAAALRRALGLGAPAMAPGRWRAPSARSVEYDGMAECFANERRVLV